MSDFMMRVDDYGNEKRLVNGEEFIYVISNCLYNKLGFIPEIPTIGLNLKERRYIILNDDTKIDQLKSDIYEMATKLYPYHKIIVECLIKKDSGNTPYLYVEVINGTLGIGGTYNYKTDTPTINIRYKEYNK